MRQLYEGPIKTFTFHVRISCFLTYLSNPVIINKEAKMHELGETNCCNFKPNHL